MWEDWSPSLKPDLRVYRKMVGPIELDVKLKRIPLSMGEEWFVYFDGWATLADSGGPYFADSFDDLRTAETAAFRAACERIKFLEAPQSNRAHADYAKAMGAFGGNSWMLRHHILPRAQTYQQSHDKINAIATYRLALNVIDRHRQALLQCQDYFAVYYPGNEFEEYMADVVSMKLKAETILKELGASE